MEADFYSGEESEGGINLKKLFFGKAFITFEEIETANKVIDKWESKHLNYRGKKL